MTRKKPKSVMLVFETPDYEVTYDVERITSKRENIMMAGIRTEEIAEIRPAFFKIDAQWYTELGVAKPYHPTPGSLGFNCLTYSGEVCSFQLIPYYDFNPEQDHCNGLRHWNNGGRIIDRYGEAHLVRELKGIPHTIKRDYAWVKWTMIPGPDGKPKSMKVHRPRKPLAEE